MYSVHHTIWVSMFHNFRIYETCSLLQRILEIHSLLLRDLMRLAIQKNRKWWAPFHNQHMVFHVLKLCFAPLLHSSQSYLLFELENHEQYIWLPWWRKWDVFKKLINVSTNRGRLVIMNISEVREYLSISISVCIVHS